MHFNQGKCPGCQKPMMNLVWEPIDAKAPALSSGGSSYRAIAFSCPMCQTVVGAQIDPIAVRKETVAQVVDELFKRLRK